MSSPSTPSLARFTGIAAATVSVVCAAGAWPTYSVGGRDGLVGMGMAAALALVSSVGGYLPILSRAAAASIEARAQAWMIGLGIRLFVTLGVLLTLWTVGLRERESLLIWTGALYVVLLVVETVVVARTLRSPDARVPHGTETSA